MEIRQLQGNKGNFDTLYLIKSEGTDGWEPFTILKLFALIKLIQNNEIKIRNHRLEQNLPIIEELFEKAVHDSLTGKTMKEIAVKYFLDIKEAENIDESFKNKQLTFFVRS